MTVSLDDHTLIRAETRAGRKAVELLVQLFPFQALPREDESGTVRHGFGRPIHMRPMTPATASHALRSDVVLAQQILRGRVFELLAVHPDAEARLPYLYAVGDILGSEKLRDAGTLWDAMRRGDWQQVAVEMLACEWDRYYGATPQKRKAVIGLVMALAAPNPTQ